MVDDPLDRLKALAVIASDMRPRGTVLAHYFTMSDAMALRACVEEIERQRDLIRQLSERVAICSELLGKHAECERVIANLRAENAELRHEVASLGQMLSDYRRDQCHAGTCKGISPA